MGGVWLVFLGTVICPGFWKIPISSNMPRRLGYYKMLGLKLISISEKVGVILVLCGGFFGLSQTCIVTCTPYAYAFVFLPIKKKCLHVFGPRKKCLHVFGLGLGYQNLLGGFDRH